MSNQTVVVVKIDREHVVGQPDTEDYTRRKEAFVFKFSREAGTNYDRPPHETNSVPGDRQSEQWIYHCSDGIVWMTVVKAGQFPTIVAAPGIGVSGLHEF